MKQFAVVEDNIVTNVIVADTKLIAQTVTGLTCIEYTDSDNVAISSVYNPDTKVFSTPRPYPSWQLDSNFEWQAPTPKPTTEFVFPEMCSWNEDLLEWTVYTVPNPE
jgi:hypothetical protein